MLPHLNSRVLHQRDNNNHNTNVEDKNVDVDKESDGSRSGTEDTENEFPSLVGKTYDMVDDPRTDNIITWAEDGNGFVVKNAEAFCSKILPTYFRTKRFRSFVRNLNMYGFRSRKQAQEGVYRFKHPQFRRGKKNLLTKIRKKTTQKSILTDLRGSIKNLRQDYNKLARSHARMEEILAQITQVLPLGLLQNLRKNMQTPQTDTQKAVLAKPVLQKCSSSSSGAPISSSSTSSADASRASPFVGPLNLNLKMEENIFAGIGSASMSPTFPFDGTQNQFGWPLLNPQA